RAVRPFVGRRCKQAAAGICRARSDVRCIAPAGSSGGSGAMAVPAYGHGAGSPPARPVVALLRGRRRSARRGNRTRFLASRLSGGDIMKMDLVIRNVRVWDDKPLMDIAIKDGKIAAIEEGIDASAAEVIDAEGRAVIPGMVEPHMHLEKAFLHRRMPPVLGTLEEA